MGDNPPEKTDMCSTAVGLNTLPQSLRFLSAYRKTVQGAGLQMCRNTSKGGNDAMSIYTRSETDSDYIRQAKLQIFTYSPRESNHPELYAPRH